MRSLRILLLAIFYFASVFFAVAALAPTIAVPVAWFAVLLAMLAYLPRVGGKPLPLGMGMDSRSATALGVLCERMFSDLTDCQH